MSTRPLSVLIVGAGIGGMTTALALSDLGANVTVLERVGGDNDVGAGIQISPNATRILISLGLGEFLDSVSVNPAEQVRRRWRDGEIIAIFPMGDRLIETYGAPYWQLHRRDLYRALLRGCTAFGRRSQITLIPNATVVTVESDEHGASATTSDGRSFESDIVIGADGLRSTVRAAAGFTDNLECTDEISFRALIPTERLRADAATRWVTERPSNTLWYGPGAHCVHYFIESMDRLCLVVQKQGTDQRLRSVPNILVGRDEFVASLDGWDFRIEAMLNMADDDVLMQPLWHRRPDPSWVRARIALLGDAAHAMLPYLGQGASQAIEDAGVLREALRGCDSAEAPSALLRYQRHRFLRAATIQAASEKNKIFFHLPDGKEQRRRDRALRRDFRGDGDVTFEWMWSGAEPLVASG